MWPHQQENVVGLPTQHLLAAQHGDACQCSPSTTAPDADMHSTDTCCNRETVKH